jgi:hypothetical protein
METAQTSAPTTINESVSGPTNIFGVLNIQNALIVILLVLLIFSLLGINLLSIFGGIFESGVSIVKPFVLQVLSIFGYTTGSLINTTADAVTDTTKAGLDIAEGTIQSVGNLLIDASMANTPEDLKKAVHFSPLELNGKREPQPDESSNVIQKSITSGKTQWCLVGEYQNKRGCVEVGKEDKCMSGQVFPSQMSCMNPTRTTNMPPQGPPQGPAQGQVQGPMQGQVQGPIQGQVQGPIQGPIQGR